VVKVHENDFGKMVYYEGKGGRAFIAKATHGNLKMLCYVLKLTILLQGC